MDEIVYRLLDFENRFGTEILSDKTKLPALIKDYFPNKAKEQRIIAKGLELDIYKRIVNATIADILRYRRQTVKELCEEHGTNVAFAEGVIDLWIRVIEKKRKIEILKNKAKDLSKTAIDAYKKNMMTDEAPISQAVIYDKQKPSLKELDSIENSITADAAKKNSSTIRPGGPLSSRWSVKTSTSSINNLLHTAVQEAYEEFLHLAEEDDPTAQGIIGMCYYVGKNVDKDYEEAVKWFEKAANKGQTQSQSLLGYCYFHGEGVAQNYNKAIHWFTKAAQKGDSSAQTILGSCYFKGLGVERNFHKAILWYEKAANQGFAEAQFALGECYYLGDGVKKNKYTALKWLEKAAAQNHQQALLYMQELSALKARMKANKTPSAPVRDYNNSDWYARKYANNLLGIINNDELLNKFIIHSNANNITPLVKNKITGLGLRIDEDEYPLFILNTGKKSTIGLFSDYILFTTKGIYISQPLKRRKFLYYADISAIIAENDEKRILINNYLISLEELPYESAEKISEIIGNTAKHFK